MSNFKKTILTAISLCSVFMLGAVYIQLRGQNNSGDGCSYLDPLAIDILAFTAGLFLASEGVYRITRYRNAPVGEQLSRIIRIALGLAIVAIHVMQFVHK